MRFKHRGLQRCIESCELPENDENQIHPDVSLKFVVADQNDLMWAKEIAEHYPELPCYVQPCNSEADITVDNRAIAKSLETETKFEKQPYDQKQKMLWLIDAVQSLNWNDVRILPQLHVWLNVE